MTLQNTFYIIGIICMSLILVILIALVAAVFVIRAKVNAIHENLSQKLNVFSNIADKGAETVDKVKRLAHLK